MYRSNISSLQGAFVLPESLRLLPIFVLSLLKHPAFALHSATSYDSRVQALNDFKSMPLDCFMAYIYPRLYGLHTLTEQNIKEDDDGNETLSVPRLALSAEKLTRYGLYLMEYGLGMFIWVSKDSPQELIQNVLGVPHFGGIVEDMTALPSLDNGVSNVVNMLISQIKKSRQHFMPLLVIREDGPNRLQFINKLVEDRTDYGTTYFEFISHLQRQLSK